MSFNEIISGKYYVAYYEKNEQPSIIKAYNDGNLLNASGIRIKTKIYSRSNGWSCNIGLRLATNSEIAHLNACIKANKYVEPESINKIIEIW